MRYIEQLASLKSAMGHIRGLIRTKEKEIRKKEKKLTGVSSTERESVSRCFCQLPDGSFFSSISENDYHIVFIAPDIGVSGNILSS